MTVPGTSSVAQTASMASWSLPAALAGVSYGNITVSNLQSRSLTIPLLVPQSRTPTGVPFPLSLRTMLLLDTSATRLLSDGRGILFSDFTVSSRSAPAPTMAPFTVPSVRILITRSRVSMPEIPGTPCFFMYESSVFPPYIMEGCLQYSLTTRPRTWTASDWSKPSAIP